MHVLVTGAGGFSGAEVVLALLARGHRVTAVAGSTRGCLPEGAERLGSLRVIAGDVSGDLALPAEVDVIVHAAGRSDSSGGGDPGTTIDDMVRDNVLSTLRLVKHARLSHVRKFIYFSTVSICGRIETAVIDETTPSINPTPYAQTKRMAEELIASAENTFSSLAIRLPGVLGRASVRNWMTNVLAAAREGREIRVINPKTPFNNAVHVTDLSRFVCQLLDLEWTGADAITIGAAGQIAVGNAVRLVVDAFGRRARITHETTSDRGFLISNVRACERYGYDPMEISDMVRRFAAENSDPLIRKKENVE